MRLGLAGTLAVAAVLSATAGTPAYAQMPPPPPMMHGGMGPMHPGQIYTSPVYGGPIYGGPAYEGQQYDAPWTPPMTSPGDYRQQREQWDLQRADWLEECRYNNRQPRHRGLLGAIFGGVAGGFVGREIAGRDDRALGTVAGAAVGALAGSAIERSGDRRRPADWCEAYLDRYAAPQTRMMMVPVPAPQPERCVETTTVEYIDGPRQRMIPPRARRVIHDKRILITPDKRVRI